MVEMVVENIKRLLAIGEFMRIEISDRKYWKELNYYDGLLYCQLLEIDGKMDWRMIEDIVEWNTIDDRKGIVDRVNGHIWFKVDVHTKYFTLDENYTVVPVRDL